MALNGAASAQAAGGKPRVARALWLAFWVSLGCSPTLREPPSAAPKTRSKLVLSVDGEANGLYWSASRQSLFVSDAAHERILEWTDAHGFAVVAQLASTPSRSVPQQLVVLPDGTLVVARSRPGSSQVLLLVPGAEPAIVPGLDPERRRLGLGLGFDGQIFSSWTSERRSAAAAGLSELSLGGSEREVSGALESPAGVLVGDADLFVSDRGLGAVLRAARHAPEALDVFARVEAPSWLASGPEGALFAASSAGTLYRIDATGAASIFDAGYADIRGIAYDEQRRRLFVIEQRKTGTSERAEPRGAAEAEPHSMLYISSVD